MDNQTQLRGDLVLLTGDKQPFAEQQIALLKAIHACGSISKAAKAVGISYKTAWDRIDAMNNMSSQPLVSRSTGGAKGGGTTLTPLALSVVQGFEALQQEHQRFIAQLGDKLNSLSDVANFIRGESVKASARNQLLGTITKISQGKVSAEIELDIGVSQPLHSMVTMESISSVPFKVGDTAIALIKAPTVMISTDVELKTSARNRLTGVIARINRGSVNSEVILQIGDGKMICATITDAGVQALGLQENQTACAVFSAANVVLLKGY